MVNKKIVSLILGITIILVGIYGIGFSENIYLDEEFKVQKQVIDTFDLKDTDLKPLFMRDIYDDTIAKETPEIRAKVTECLINLNQEGDSAAGDFLPMIFLKGKEKVFIGVKHPNNTITLVEFDIAKDKAEKINKQVKEAK